MNESNLFVLADEFGIIYNFLPFIGKIKLVENPDVSDLNPNVNIVLDLAKSIPNGQNYCISFDNYLHVLLQHLALRKIWLCGTTQKPQIFAARTSKNR